MDGFAPLLVELPDHQQLSVQNVVGDVGHLRTAGRRIAVASGHRDGVPLGARRRPAHVGGQPDARTPILIAPGFEDLILVRGPGLLHAGLVNVRNADHLNQRGALQLDIIGALGKPIHREHPRLTDQGPPQKALGLAPTGDDEPRDVGILGAAVDPAQMVVADPTDLQRFGSGVNRAADRPVQPGIPRRQHGHHSRTQGQFWRM